MNISSHLIIGVSKIILNIFPNNIELILYGISSIFLFYFITSFYFYCYNFSNQMIIHDKYRKKVINILSQSDNSIVDIAFYAFWVCFIYFLTYFVIFGIIFEDIFQANFNFWIFNFILLLFSCACYYYYFFKIVDRWLLLKVKNYKIRLEFVKTYPVFQIFLLGYFYQFSSENVFNSRLPFFIIMIISFLVMFIIIKKKRKFETLIRYFESYQDLSAKIQKSNKKSTLKRKFKQQVTIKQQQVKKKNLEKLKYIEEFLHTNKSKNLARTIQENYIKTFLNENTQQSWNQINKLFFFFSITVPLITFIIFSLFYQEILHSEFYYLILFGVQFIISFRLFNRSKKYPTMSVIRMIVELSIIAFNIFMLIELFIDIVDFFLFFNSFYFVYLLWNFLIILEYPKLSSVELRDLYNAISYSFFIIIINLTKIKVFNDFEIIIYPFFALGFIISIEILLYYTIQSKYENINPEQIDFLYKTIKDIFVKLERSSSIKDHIKKNNILEKYFRDFFFNILDERLEKTEIESITKSGRPTDILIYLKDRNQRKSNRIIIEFKIWGRNCSGSHHPITQIIDNIGVFENFGIIIMFNIRKSNIDTKYLEEIIKNHESYLFNTLKINPLNKDLVSHYISHHRDKIKKRVKILHFLYDLENLR